MSNEAKQFQDPLSKDYHGRDEMDEILNDDSLFSDDTILNDVDQEIEKDTNKSKETSLPEPVEETKVVPKGYSNETFAEEGVVPELRGDDFPPEYINLVHRIQGDYRLLPRIDFSQAYIELGDLTIKSCATPTLQVLNDEIQKVQASKDRLSEIFIDVLKSVTFKKRAVDILMDSWNKYSTEKSQDKRKADASFRMSNFIADYAVTEGLFKACNHILKNLDSLHESLSRRITIFQLTMKLSDIGRGALPDYDFTPSSSKGLDDELFDESGNQNPKEATKAEL
jgi:hypothetical protein